MINRLLSHPIVKFKSIKILRHTCLTLTRQNLKQGYNGAAVCMIFIKSPPASITNTPIQIHNKKI